jgi:hypothetical protein
MAEHIKESDWKLFKPLREAALERFCQRVLDDVKRIAADTERTQHERYLAIWQLLKEEDKDLVRAFDFLRRSTALMQIAAFRSRGLVTDEEFNRFSEETREIVNILLKPLDREGG